MRVLFISNDLIAGHLAYLMKAEGHEVKLFVAEKDRRRNFDGLVEQTNDWKKELLWVGKEGLVVFDDIGYGKIQDKLRKQGYTVFGGCKAADDMESNRELGYRIFEKYGLKTVPIKNFSSIESAIDFVRENKAAWVIKQNGHAPKSLNYVGHFDDGSDVIDVLQNYNLFQKKHCGVIALQKRIDGVEIGVGRYFNGTDWVGPIEFNVEYKKFFPGDLGPTTSEMGTLAWYDDDDNNKLFQEVLAPLKQYLQEIDYRGDMEINCIVNENGAHPLEATPRFGSPIVHLHSEIHSSPWGEFLYAVASGKEYDLKWKKGFGIVTVVALPPLPYVKKSKEISFEGQKVYFSKDLKSDMPHIHFEEVSSRAENGDLHYYVSDNRGYVLYVTSIAETIEDAHDKNINLLEKIYVPKMFYRNDIGLSFLKNREKLKKWDYLK